MAIRLLGALCAALVVGGIGAGDARAALGDLVQRPGAAGCLSSFGSCLPGTALSGASAVAVSPDGRNAYLASALSDAVAVFDRGADGTLTQQPGLAGCVSNTGAGPCVDGQALDTPESVAVSPDGLSVYVASSTSDAVAVFDRATDGTLTQKPGAAGCVWASPIGPCAPADALNTAFSVAVSPDGGSVYVAALDSDAVVAFDRSAGGTLSQDGCVSEPAAAPCAGGRALNGASSVTVSPGGQSVYVTALIGDGVAVFDRGAGGTLTQKAGTAGCISETGAGPCADGRALDRAQSIAISPDGQTTYIGASGAVSIVDRAPNGTLAQKPGISGCISDDGAGPCADGTALFDAAQSVGVSPDGRSAYVASISDAVTAFDRAVDGTLAQKPGLAACVSETGAGPCADGTALDGPSSLAISPDGLNAYVASYNSSALAVFDRLPNAAGQPQPSSFDTARPVLRGLSVRPARFRAARRGPSIAARRPIGARVTYRLSEAARVTFRVERALKGKRVRGRCVKPRRSNLRAKRCTRYRTLRGSFSHNGRAGANKLKFSGRLRGRKLRTGRYRLRAVAADAAANKSRPRRDGFRIVRR